jgi:hypothetical protein
MLMLTCCHAGADLRVARSAALSISAPGASQRCYHRAALPASPCPGSHQQRISGRPSWDAGLAAAHESVARGGVKPGGQWDTSWQRAHHCGRLQQPRQLRGCQRHSRRGKCFPGSGSKAVCGDLQQLGVMWRIFRYSHSHSMPLRPASSDAAGGKAALRRHSCSA